MTEDLQVEKESSLEISMIPEALCEIPMKKLGQDSEEDENQFDITVSISEKSIDSIYNDTFSHLEIEVRVGSPSPLLKAYDLYTQYAGIRGVMIKHGSRFWKPGLLLYTFFPNWDNEEDRIVDPNTVATKFEYSADYEGGTGLKAHSIVYEVSPEDELEVGMIIGEESGGTMSRAESKDIVPIKVKLSEHRIIQPKSNLFESASGLDPKNPLFEREIIFKDYHPIPTSIYMVDYYYQDPDFPGVIRKGEIEGAIFNPNNLKSGFITKSLNFFPNFTYWVKCIDSGSPSQLEQTELKIENQSEKRSRGDFVILGKREDDSWVILPGTKNYYTGVVDYLRDEMLGR